jgi:hypothetical protein
MDHREIGQLGGRVLAARDKCSNGHLYTEETTYVTRRGTRQCRICQREYLRRWRTRRVDQ